MANTAMITTKPRTSSEGWGGQHAQEAREHNPA
jgi:hypothetical protein